MRARQACSPGGRRHHRQSWVDNHPVGIARPRGFFTEDYPGGHSAAAPLSGTTAGRGSSETVQSDLHRGKRQSGAFSSLKGWIQRGVIVGVNSYLQVATATMRLILKAALAAVCPCVLAGVDGGRWLSTPASMIEWGRHLVLSPSQDPFLPPTVIRERHVEDLMVR